MSQYPAIIELLNLNGSNGFWFSGEAQGDMCGSSVASGGDVNGDGFADLIVGAPNADHAHGYNSGASYVIFGKGSGFSDTQGLLSILDGTNGFQIDGKAPYDDSGKSVSSAGDVNGDGFADLIIGAPGAGPNGSHSGATYVVFGKASGFDATIELSTLNGTNGFQINGEASNQSGYSVDSAGDINGDGFADLIIGAPGAIPNGGHSGATYVMFGKASGFDATIKLSALNGTNGFQINGGTDEYTGYSVASAGDVNGDGFADLIVSARGTETIGTDRTVVSYVVFGKASGFGATIELSTLNGTNGFQINGERLGYSTLGPSVSSAGDINGDGFDDLIVGTITVTARGPKAGAAHVVFGKASGFDGMLELSSLDGTNGFEINGKSGNDLFGWSVSSAGDVNGDGFADLIVGAPAAGPHGSFSGVSYVVFGKASGFSATLDPSTLDGTNGFQIVGAGAGDRSGFSVASAGDVNGDGFDDLIIGARSEPTHGVFTGASYVIFGSMPGEAVTRTGTAVANTIHGGDFDDTLSGLGGDDILYGHSGKDRMLGGRDDDTLVGGAGKDTLNGGSGADHFIYLSASDSTGRNYDIIKSPDFGLDIWDVPGTITGIDLQVDHGALSKGSAFDANLSAAVDATHLGSNHAVLFIPDSGNLSGKIFMVVDLNGLAGYQGGADLVVQLTTPQHIENIDISDFI